MVAAQADLPSLASKKPGPQHCFQEEESYCSGLKISAPDPQQCYSIRYFKDTSERCWYLFRSILPETARPSPWKTDAQVPRRRAVFHLRAPLRAALVSWPCTLKERDVGLATWVSDKGTETTLPQHGEIRM